MAESVIRNPVLHDLDEDFVTVFNLQQETLIVEGMCGEIVLASEKNGDRCVVKKFTLLCEEDRARNEKMFSAEVQFMQSFDHPFIMKCLYAGRCPEYMAHCTDYYQRGTLYDCLGELSLELNELCFTQVSCALRYLHKNNVAHLDVKLENIFLDSDSNAVLGDFGLAVELSPHKKMLTKDQCGGTPCYFAPERRGAADDNALDPYKMDSYCLGVVLWALVFVRFPNDSIHYYQEARRKRDVPSHMRSWLLKLLNRNPSKRPTVTDFVTRLRLEGAYMYVVDNN